jgi:hypothetical protein
MKNFPLEGYVVNRSGNSVTLDLGVRTGVKNGMRFIVFKEGQVIKHPKTGEVLDVERIQTGSVTIDNVMQKICTARIDEEDSPGSINYGQLVKSMIDTRPMEGRLYVDVTPAGAKIRILNISPSYTRGMVLAPGPYNIEVSAPGYITAKEWITLGLSEEKTVSFSLAASTAAPEKLRPAPPVPKEDIAPVRKEFMPPTPPPRLEQRPAVGAEQAKYLKLLESNNVVDQRDAARMITRANVKDQVVFDAVERALLRGYKMESSDREHIDAMSWLCKALGSSGMSKYRSTLNTVANNAPHKKLKGYAEKSMNEL